MHKASPWILVLFLMQMTKLKYGAKTYHSKVPLRFIKITVDYKEHLQLLKAYRIKFQKFAAHAHKDALINETFIPT